MNLLESGYKITVMVVGITGKSTFKQARLINPEGIVCHHKKTTSVGKSIILLISTSELPFDKSDFGSVKNQEFDSFVGEDGAILIMSYSEGYYLTVLQFIDGLKKIGKSKDFVKSVEDCIKSDFIKIGDSSL